MKIIELHVSYRKINRNFKNGNVFNFNYLQNIHMFQDFYTFYTNY